LFNSQNFWFRLERDVSMKRQLIDELRIKSKENETKLKDEYNGKVGELFVVCVCEFKLQFAVVIEKPGSNYNY